MSAAANTAVNAQPAWMAEWIEQDRAPISRPFAEFLLPKLSTRRAGSLQF